ncbi:hypothetical protein VNO80_05300 [Phaseolus coccineus]|uniref:ABC-type xenobiotic transporter n=1 Tax=Phaseolus coccineus TaxID=3886 RepID=A0AAN9NLN9_PHACN
MTVFCSLGVSAFSFVLCLFNYFYWYSSGWSEEELVTLFDLVLKTAAWGVVCVCLNKGFFSSGERRLSFLFKAWRVLYLFASCYCFVVDIVVISERRVALPTQYLVCDVVSTCVGLLFCYVGYFVKNKGHVREKENKGIQEPLLNGDTNGDALRSEETRGGDTVTPFSHAGILSLLTFSWVGPLIDVGNKKILDLEDVPQLDSRDSVVGAFPGFRGKLEADCGTINGVTTLKLVKSLVMISWKEILFTAFLALFHTLASYVGPYLMDGFVQYLDGQRLYENQGYVLISAFFFAKMVECLSQLHRCFRLQQVGLRMRALLVTMIYNKALTLSSQSKHGHTYGEIINFMAVDAERVGVFSWYIHDLWMVALKVTLAFLILYKNLGLASIAAFVATIVVMLVNVPLGSLQEKFQKKLMQSKDTRMKATSEILRNMNILKLQGWEMKFLSKITELRKTEQGWLKKGAYIAAMSSFLFRGAPTFVGVVTFGTCMLGGVPLESGKILSALATFGILQEPIYNLPDTISMIAQTKVSLDRIASFLRLDDLPSDVVEKLPRGSSDTAIEVVGGNFSRELSSPNPTLQNINLKVFNGMKVAVCGTVGSGKSTFLSCLLGEVPKISGILRVCGTKAYVTQSPWIQSGKIEDNILFGKQMDREKYEKVLEACSLKKDLEILSFGDQTIIGERGINLSGGQKQRIQIARALYQDSDIYLFDDPFSAVDAHTGSHLFKECLLGLLSSKTVVYVTHQVEFLPAADHILVMKDGKITQCGKYNDLLNYGADFMELVGAHKKALSTLDSLDGATVSDEISTLEQHVNVSGTQGSKDKEEEASEDEQNGNTNKSEPKVQFVPKEERVKGKVGFSVYWKCITTAYGGALVPFILLAQILFQVLQIGSNYWMAWATPISADVEPPVEGTTLIVVYVSLAIGSSLCILAREMLLVTTGYKTATILFSKMHYCIFRAPMSFFDSTPSGRILNRVSTDQNALDTNIPHQIASFSFITIQLLEIIAVMSQAAWQVLVVIIPVIIVSICYQQYYIPSARELSRLVGVCKAPLTQHFSETISGTSTIRSFDQQSRFQETNMKLTDGYSRPKFNIAGAMEWLCFRLDMLSSIIFSFSLIFIISIPQEFIDPGLAGLAITYGLNLNNIQASMIWNLCKMESKIISVERILQYTSIPNEPPLVIDENQPNPSWPSNGEIDIQDLQVRYAPHLPLVLCGLTCKFRGGLKTGIVGRTGSGKSTLIQTLFRIVEPAVGQVMIDNINISSIGLHDLRSRLSIIPQDPTMFEGTVRNNLDPLEEYTDDQIWEALDKCQLGDEVRKKEGKLDSNVSENGENWSMGQRQLKFTTRVRDESKEKLDSTLFKTTVFVSLGVSVFSFVLCLFNHFYWYSSGWSEEELVTLLDLVLKTVAWGVVCVCLNKGFFSSGERRFSFLFRAWCVLYLSVSCYCFVVDIVVKSERRVALPTQFLVSDVVSTCVGMLFCYVGYFVKNQGHVREKENNCIQEPLLNGGENDGDALRSKGTRGGDTVTPFSYAGILSLLTFSWVGPLIAVGYEKTLDFEDVPQLDSRDSVVGVFPGFRDKLEADCGTINSVTTLKLVKSLVMLAWKEILFTAFLAVLSTLASYVGPYLIDSFVQYLDGQRLYENQGYVLVCAFFFAKIVECLTQRHWFFRVQLVGLRIRALLVTMIYNKALTLSCQSKQGQTSGEIINFMTVDTERVGAFTWYMHDLWMVALQVTLALLILYKNLGLASIAAFVATILVMLANVPLGSLQEKFQKKLMESKDARRPRIPLESGKMLSALATFRILQEPIYGLPDTISMIAQTKVSLDRIASFLRLDDLPSDVVEKLPRGSSDSAIEVVDGNFSWELSSPNPTLQNINLRVFHGMRVAVCGTVGSGKSTLLSCVLGEVPKISGMLKVCGTKAYVTQSPWIQSGKIEDNILFGKQMDREKYEKVLDACSLKKDLEILSFGDQTVIGERGINLSGGQKQRIQIARALYQDADIYLFDDPFSAVDAHTGSHLFKECLLGLLSSKTVVYVTHQVEFLPAADLIVVMKSGKMTQCGKYADLLNSGADFMELVGAHEKALSTLDSLDGATVSNEISTLEQDLNVAGMHGVIEEASKDEQNGGTNNKSEPQGELVQEEEREKGKVEFSVYWKCITTAYGGAVVPFILLAQILFEGLQIGSNYWMAWATPISMDVELPVEGTTLIVVYVCLAIGSSFCILARTILLVTTGYKTATILFNKMHFCIFRAPMSFFDSTPSGRILNRASTDQSALDTEIPYQIASFAFIVIQLLGIIAVMSQAAWQVFVVFIPVIAVSLWYQQYYIPSARELSRLVGVCKAPNIQHFSETISGTSTIRSFDQQSRFQETNMKLTDGYSRPKFNIAGAMEWLSIRLEMLSSITFAFSLIFLISIPAGSIDPGLAGLAVTYGLNLNIIQAWLIWNLCNMENKIISVERILQYTCIPSEPPLVVDENPPDPSWPSNGEVDIQDLQGRYAPHLPLVLRGIT